MIKTQQKYFIEQTDTLKISNYLQTTIVSNNDVSQYTMSKLFATMKDKHLLKKIVKFNRKKQKRAKWMKNDILHLSLLKIYYFCFLLIFSHVQINLLPPPPTPIKRKIN